VTVRTGVFFEIEVRGRTPEVEQQAFENVLAQIVLAEELGFGSAWFVEHHFTRGFSHSSAPDLMIAAAARLTHRIRLGLGVVLLPFVHPVRTAERVATLDILSKGRIEFGTGRGASPLEYQAFKRPFELSREIWEENLDAVLQIWAADGEPLEIEHDLWAVPNVSVYPRPVQNPHPPVWVASTSLDGFIAAAKQGYDLLCMPILKGIDDLAEDLAQYKQTLAAHDFDPDERRIAMLVPWHVAATHDEAISASADAMVWYIRRQVNQVVPPGYTDARHASYRVMGQLAAGLPPEEAISVLNEHGMAVLDDVEGSRKAMARFVDAGATDILGQFQVGGLDHEATASSMKLFANEVVCS